MLRRLLGVLLLAVGLVVCLPQGPVGRSVPRVLPFTRPFTSSSRVVHGFSLNGIAVGQLYSRLRPELASDISEQGDQEQRVLLDAVSGAALAIDLDSSGRIWRVRAGGRTTLMRNGAPVCSLGDPMSILSNFPWPRRLGEDNRMIFDDKERAQVLVVLGPDNVHGLELIAENRFQTGSATRSQ